MPDIRPISDDLWSAILDCEGTDPCPGVVDVEEVTIAPATDERPALIALIWRPVEAMATPAPGLLDFHGGGFCLGHPSGCGALAKALALSLGVVTVAPSYRPGTAEAPVFPGIVEDGATAWCWIQEHADELGIDPRRIAVAGGSAGCLMSGHLATRSPYVAPQLGSLPGPAAWLCQWGPVDFVSRWFDNGEIPGAEANLFGPGGHQAHPARYLHASVLTWARGQLPPACFIYGRQDSVVHKRQGQLGHAAWQEAGVHSEFLVLPNIGHGVQGDNRPQRQQLLQKLIDFSAWRWAQEPAVA